MAFPIDSMAALARFTKGYIMVKRIFVRETDDGKGKDGVRMQ